MISGVVRLTAGPRSHRPPGGYSRTKVSVLTENGPTGLHLRGMLQTGSSGKIRSYEQTNVGAQITRGKRQQIVLLCNDKLLEHHKPLLFFDRSKPAFKRASDKL